jgi:hypothetical protein
VSPAVRRLLRPTVILPSVLALAAVGVGVPVALASRPDLTVTGLRDGALVGASAARDLAVRVAVSGASASKVDVTLDGQPAQVTRSGNELLWRPASLSDGRHELTVSAPGSLVGSAKVTRSFTVDTTPPGLQVTKPDDVPSMKTPVTITGTADGATEVTADGKPVKVQAGKFTLELAAPPTALKLVAQDAAGNTTTDVVSVPVRHPMIRGVHATGYAWNYKPLRDGIIALIKAHKINTVELDIKEEDGFVNYDTSVKLAHEAGAIRKLYDPKTTIAALHKMGVRVVGRIVCFRDPKLAPWAWAHGHKDWVVQTPTGAPYSSKYGSISFTNFGNQAVRDYNIDLAVEAAKLGFDDVMYDYVRRPDGPIAKMHFPGLKVSPVQSVADFVKETSGPVRAQGAYLGLAVFGVSATRPKEVGQDIPTMAKYVDYVAPMLYPSHWAPGEYNVANPNAQPYDIVFRSLKDFEKKVAGTKAQVMPWLQDFSLGLTYGPAQVKAQIKATFDEKLTSFFLWDAGCSYTAVAIPTLPAT